MAENPPRLSMTSINQAPLSAAFASAWSQWLEIWPELANESGNSSEAVTRVIEEAHRLTRRLWRDAFAAVGDAPGSQAKAMVYAFVALLDETLVFSPWPGQAAWQQKPLEMRLFGSRTAGERLPRAIKLLLAGSDPGCRDLANVYLQCLNLGFQGRLRGTGGRALHEKWRRALFAFAWQREADLHQVGSLLEQPAAISALRQPLRRMLPDSLRLGLYIGAGLLTLLLLGQLFWHDIARHLEPELNASFFSDAPRPEP